MLGKETIDSYNQSENRGAQTSHGLNYQKLGKELMSTGRNRNDGRRQVYFAGARREAVFQ